MKLTLAFALAAPLAFAACRHDGDRVSLVRVHSELEANKLLSALDLCGVSGADKRAEGTGKAPAWTVLVHKRDLVTAERVRLEFALPRDERDDANDESALPGLESPQRELERSVRATERKLERTLEAHPRVVVASVHLPVRRLTFSGERASAEPSCASVLVRYLPEPHREDPIEARDVQRLVAGALEGLAAERVEVVLQRIELPAAREPAPEGELQSVPSAQKTTYFEAFFTAVLAGLMLALAGAWLWQRKRRAAPEAAA